jgi:hypothetical protein
MGDWRKARRGLTANERGIPVHLLKEHVTAADFDIDASLCMFPGWSRLPGFRRLGRWNSALVAWLDLMVCQVLRPNHRYHARSMWQKVRPIEAVLVLRRKTANGKASPTLNASDS